MARQDPKTVLADLTKAVVALTEKISAQSMLIDAQNKKLKDQQQLLDDQRKVVEELHVAVSTLQASMCVQSVGEKSEKESLDDAKCESSKPTPTTISARGRRAVDRASKLTASKQPAISASKKKTPIVPSTPPLKRKIDNQQTKDDIVGPLNTPETKSTPSTKTSGSEWQEVRRAKRKSRSPIVVEGTGTDIDSFQTVAKLKFIQAWYFKPDTSEQQIRNYLNKIVKSEEYIVEKRVIKTDRHAAFVIGMPENLYPQLALPTSWPQGVRFADWFRVRPRAERGSSTSTGP